MSALITEADLPAWLTLMQAVAWIAARNPAVVLRASLDADDVAKAASALGDDRDWCSSDFGLSLIAIDHWCACADASQDARKELLSALRKAKVFCLGNTTNPVNGEQHQEMPASEWTHLHLDADPATARKLVPHRWRDQQQMHAQPVEHWRDVCVETKVLLSIWPPHQAVDADGHDLISPAWSWPELPISQDGRELLLPDDYYIPALNTLVWLARRHNPKRQMDLDAAVEAIQELVPHLRSGKLTAFLIDAEDAGKEPEKVRTDLFVRGMTLHASGKLTKDGSVSMEDYAALHGVPTGPIWFVRAELMSLWPAQSAIEVLGVPDPNRQPTLPSTASASSSTVGAKTECETWLTALMQASPNVPRRKNDVWNDAVAKFNASASGRLSKRGFVAAWTNAVSRTGCVAWSSPGRRPQAG